ncbi:MAG: hypothetical protein LBU99_03015 [Spirochaetaceae bacterium]|jgi:methyltransferase-like protein|nr:hypothetical protein [Spirochaetaceae bacterium]
MTEKRQAILKDVLNELKTALDKSKKQLTPYMTTLTPEELRKLPKTGEKTINFVKKAHMFAQEPPNLVPPCLDMDAFTANLENTLKLQPLIDTLKKLEQTLSDIKMIAGSEAYQAALTFYGYVKIAETQRIPSAEIIYKELKKYFVKNKRKPDTLKN